MTKRLLLTGIGGSIGCHTMRHILQNTDWDVVGIDSFRHKGLTDRVEVMLNAHPEDRARVKIFTHDITAPFSEMLINKIGKIDYIISMGSLSDVHDSIVNPVPFIQNNVNLVATINSNSNITFTDGLDNAASTNLSLPSSVLTPIQLNSVVFAQGI